MSRKGMWLWHGFGSEDDGLIIAATDWASPNAWKQLSHVDAFWMWSSYTLSANKDKRRDPGGYQQHKP
jgi:hypothetical protein